MPAQGHPAQCCCMEAPQLLLHLLAVLPPGRLHLLHLLLLAVLLPGRLHLLHLQQLVESQAAAAELPRAPGCACCPALQRPQGLPAALLKRHCHQA
jgi:hypothetical protein